MNMKILKLKVEGLQLFEDESFEVDFITDKKTSAYEIEDKVVEPLINSVYKLNTIALLGVNASGKTTTLKIISDILMIYLNNSGLSNDLSISRQFYKKIKVETFYWECNNKKLIKLISIIKKDDFNNMYFEEEYMYINKSTSGLNRTNVFDYNNSIIPEKRSEVSSEYLKSTDSIFSRIMNSTKNQKELVLNLSLLTGSETKAPLVNFDHMLEIAASYLDPSIDYLETIGSNDLPESNRYVLKFKDNEEVYNLNRDELEMYLSAGTIKGINLLNFVYGSLKFGGYIVVDELENHFNKVIVEHIIRLFLSDLNHKSATLIFSTHYSELIDTIDRTDSIYLLKKNKSISVNKYSVLGKDYDKSDKKKSNVILSGVLGTAPSFKAYKKLENHLKCEILTGDENDI